MFGSAGGIIGWVRFANSTGNDLAGDVVCTKPASSVAKYYSAGFTNELAVLGARYASPPLSWPTGTLVLTARGLSSPITNSITFGPNGRVVAPSPIGLKLAFTSSTGSFKGSALNPQNGLSVAFQGVLFQKGNSAGYGFFLGSNQSGEVLLIQP